MTAMRPETTSEHIARDMREGRFPERSEPQMVADPAATAPERIWAIEDGFGDNRWSMQEYDGATEYVRAIPTIDPACDHCGVDPAAIREAALREAAAEIKLWWASVDDAREPDELIITMIGEKK